ncbi:hypothetical protein AMTRI_Chr11g94290 [Amborella trichopoda]|uniref:Rho-GAP domain-containing protein n=1 Tax=Amborella trichopoda TaxID=13333 RepID=W1PY74_AMBTC|nr:rho GTPase-activating protein 5 [Amborella trichopoda]ERN13009.1 hypothetical protein AMTR_s00040p00091880 [Amborella trichopoda]|eukprot:XP_006851428.1 rho GTPase-activating protein 5 [Amborella trichopoda]
MTEVLHSSQAYGPEATTTPCFPSSSSSFSSANDDPHVEEGFNNPNSPLLDQENDQKEDESLSLVALLLTAFRKSVVACRTGRDELGSMEIGWPTNVRHVAHVTFDRFNGFLGLPVEFEPEVPRRAPSASANVFGVSTESMQLSFDSRGNSVPTILLLMQNCLYSQGGLRAEGIFRINAENSQEEYVRDQLNKGIVPEGVDVHCLAGLIKAWFRELPSGVLDSLSPEEVMQSNTEEEYARLVRLLPPTEAALLDWAINLMADVVQEEHLNKMNARNVAMVFAPNMTQMADPLTALMYAVQVMNFLKTLIIKTLREREEPVLEAASCSSNSDPPKGNGDHGSSQRCPEAHIGEEKEEERETHQEKEGREETGQSLEASEAISDGISLGAIADPLFEDSGGGLTNSREKSTHSGNGFSGDGSTDTNSLPNGVHKPVNGLKIEEVEICCKNKTCSTGNLNGRKSARNGQPKVQINSTVEKSRGINIISRINSRVERVEAWR